MKTGFEIEKEECGDWLKAISNESEIALKEIADGVGVSYAKIYKWASNEKKMSAAEKSKVESFVRKGIRYNGYKRMKKRDFSEILRNLLFEFEAEITQDELAEKVGCLQKTISDCQNIYKSTAVDVETQYKILNVFYYLCFSENGEILKSHKLVLHKLAQYGIGDGHFTFSMRELIESGIYEPDSICDEDFGEQVFYSSGVSVEKNILERFAEFNYNVQCIILNHFKVFCWTYNNFDCIVACITKFRELSEECKNKFIVQMKNSVSYETYAKSSNIELGECEDELYRDFYFDMITEYRDMIKILRENPDITKQSMQVKRKSSKQIERNLIRFSKKILAVIDEAERVTCGNYDSDITFKLIDFKLTLSYIEWYICMLLNLSNINSNDIMNLLNSIES